MNVSNIQKPQPPPASATKPSVAAAAPRASRMSLTNVVKGPLSTPVTAIGYGLEGVGKSTFAAGAPNPIFFGCDKGTSRLDIARMPEPRSWDEVLEGLSVLEHEAHEYKTLVIDTLNSLEPLCWLKVTNGVCSIEEYAKGYGRGHNAALDHWRVMISALERIKERRGIHVILLAHTLVKNFNNPLGPNFDRYEIAMNHKAAGLFKQWVDFVLFMREEAFGKADDQKNIKGTSTGARFIHTQWSAAYDAKARGWLPAQVPLSWNEFFTAAHEGPKRKAEFLAQIEAGLAELADAEVEKKVREYLADARVDVAEVANAVAAKVQKKKEEQQATETQEG